LLKVKDLLVKPCHFLQGKCGIALSRFGYFHLSPYLSPLKFAPAILSDRERMLWLHFV